MALRRPLTVENVIANVKVEPEAASVRSYGCDIYYISLEEVDLFQHKIWIHCFSL